MIQDGKGHELRKGDRVILEFEVTDVWENTTTGHNVHLRAIDPYNCGETRPEFSCNARLMTRAAIQTPADAPAAERELAGAHAP